MRYMDELDEYPIEKRVSVFKRNDRESAKGIKPLPSNQNSYVLRDVYTFKGDTGYFMHLIRESYRQFTTPNMVNIIEVRLINTMVTELKLWNKLMAWLHLPKLIWYSPIYGKTTIDIIKENHLEQEYLWVMRRYTLTKEEKIPRIMYPYGKSLYVLHHGYNDLYAEVGSRYLFEREENGNGLNELSKYYLQKEPEVDPRGPGMRIYPHYAEFDHLQGEALVNAYLDSEPMIELILARCEQEIEIRINESLIRVDEVVEKIRRALEPMQWRLEVEL